MSIFKNLFLILFALFLTLSVKSQDSIYYNKSISVNLLSALAREISMTYSVQIKPKVELDINPRFQFNGASGNSFILFDVIDPSWYYKNLTLCTGLKFFSNKGWYIAPNIYNTYGFFEKKTIIINDNGDENVSRNHDIVGFALRYGYTYSKGRLRLNYNLGIGYSYTFVNEKLYRHRQVPLSFVYDPPLKSSTSRSSLTFHIGLDIGYKFK